MTRASRDGDVIDTSDTTPLYSIVEQSIRGKILDGSWEVGSQIPPELELCERYHVSRTTVRKALDALVREGLIERHRARGTFVQRPGTRRPDGHFTLVKGFSDEVHELGESAVTFWAKVRTEPADRLVSCVLDVPEGESLLVLERLRGTAGKPFTYMVSHITPCERFTLDPEAYQGSLYEMIRRKGIEPRLVQESVEAICAPAIICEHLGIGRREPVLKRTRLTRDTSAGYCELTENYYIGKSYRYYIGFGKDSPIPRARAGSA